MEDIRRRFANDVAARLAGAAESDAKAEMVEELADNLARRYEDMTAAGVGEEEAYARAMEELGDVDELTAYLNGLEPEPADAGSGSEDLEEFFRAVSDVGRAAAEAGRKAVHRAEDLLRSDAARSAVEEAKRGVYKARDAIKKAAEQGVIAWNGRNVKLDFEQDAQERYIPSQGLLRLDVELPNGDVDIRPGRDPDGPVLIEGDVDRLEIYTSEEGVLIVRQLDTASGQFLSFRGISGADVSLTVPPRKWDSIRADTASGDVDIGEGLTADKLSVRTASGDVRCRLDSCGRGEIHTASGDVDCRGGWQQLQVETVSGDVDLEGSAGEVRVATVSGDVETDGCQERLFVRSVSGDIQVKSGALPREMDLDSKSGDVEARIPDSGPFRARLQSVSGSARCADFRQRRFDAGPDGDGPRYSLVSISGDVSLKKMV